MDEQAVWHATALQLSVGPIRRRGGLVLSMMCAQIPSWMDYEVHDLAYQL